MAVEPCPVTACLIIIGNEILSGRTRDANLPFLAERLTALGIRLREVRVIPDDEAEIIAAVNACRVRYDYVFTTGGIGPTHDDITSGCIAKAFGVALVRDAEAVARLERYYAPGTLNDARLRMAEVPAGAVLIDNPISQAPGFQIGNVFVMAGVPMVMQAMVDGIVPRLVGGAVVHARTVSCYLGEGDLAAGLKAIQERYPELEIGSYPFVQNRQFGASLVLRGVDDVMLERATVEVSELVRSLGGEPVVTIGSKG